MFFANSNNFTRFFTDKFNDNYIGYKIISQFYHIINFEEKNRENLMTEYID